MNLRRPLGDFAIGEPEGHRGRPRMESQVADLEERRTAMAKDPVCGMQVDEKSTEVRLEYQGATYYFCSPGCRERFQEDPEKFAARARSDWGRP